MQTQMVFQKIQCREARVLPKMQISILEQRAESEEIVPAAKPKAKKICRVCNRVFFDTPKHAEKRVCCSRVCASILNKEKVPAANSKPKIKIICNICGKEFFDSPKHAERRICCSNKCAGILKSNTPSPMKGRPFSEEHRKNISLARQNLSIETRKKMSDAQKGKKASEESKKKMSASRTGKKNGFFGRHHTEENKKILSKKHMGIFNGEKNNNWKGGITPVYNNIRESSKYRNWRLAVFERDNFCDRITGVKGNGNLNAHHIVPFAQILEHHNISTFDEAMACEALWDINNGLTMIDTNHTIYHQLWGK